jgi:hypothetical protein
MIIVRVCFLSFSLTKQGSLALFISTNVSLEFQSSPMPDEIVHMFHLETCSNSGHTEFNSSIQSFYFISPDIFTSLDIKEMRQTTLASALAESGRYQSSSRLFLERVWRSFVPSTEALCPIRMPTQHWFYNLTLLLIGRFFLKLFSSYSKSDLESSLY